MELYKAFITIAALGIIIYYLISRLANMSFSGSGILAIVILSGLYIYARSRNEK